MSQAQQVKKIKKGEFLFKEGNPVENVYFIQAGRVKTLLARPKGQIELYTAAAPLCFAEQAFTNITKHPYSAVALTDVHVLELPIEPIKNAVEASNQILKFLVRGAAEQGKSLTQELKAEKIEKDNSPCPPEMIPRLFGAVFHTINHLGERQPDKKIKMAWSQLKQYTSRIFSIPQEKIEGACHILHKFKMVEYKFEKPEDKADAPEELRYVLFSEHEQIEQFFEFYQYFLNKAGKADFLKVNDTLYQLVHGLIAITKDVPADKFGNLTLELNPTLDYLKNEYNLQVNANHWQLLEQKGLFVKRHQPTGGQFNIVFAIDEFKRSLNAWRFIREINKWNETGAVNPHDLELPVKSAHLQGNSSYKCTDCGANLTELQKFCGECGKKVEHAA